VQRVGADQKQVISGGAQEPEGRSGLWPES